MLFHGGGSSFNNYFKNCIDIQNNGICYIGRKSTFNGVFFRICEGKNIIIGDDCMFSWDIWICPTDSHLIFDTDTYKRVNFGKSIYIGDHIWCGQEAAILKGSFIASGSILGAKSVISGTKFSNSIYAGNPAKLIKKNKFWSREDPTNGDWSKEKIRQFSAMQKEDFKFNFEKDKFLNPNLLESKLEKLETAQQKLEFVYDYIYNNTNKNRFALFENSNTNLYQLYKDKNQISFSRLNFYESKNKEKSASKLL
ncbi:acyltransferase, partial [Campylobacter sp. RM10543]|uniref:acyltransferase n=1 Tax=Campylobacter molothri TaxID=1032242 RepID=UPI00301C74C5|nr:acyltransferase [Campylobacter sp. RM10543]